MPFGSFINVVPPAGFIAIHLVLLLLGGYLAYRSFDAQLGGFGWAFTLYAVAEFFYLSYHADWTVILFAHTVAEVLDAAAFVLLFSSGVKRLAGGVGRQAPSPTTASSPTA